MKKGQAQDLPLHSDHDKTLDCEMETCPSEEHAINRLNLHHIAEPPHVDPQSDRLSGQTRVLHRAYNPSPQ